MFNALVSKQIKVRLKRCYQNGDTIFLTRKISVTNFAENFKIN